VKLSEAWPRYEADKRLRGFSQKTFDSYDLQLRLLIREIGDVDVTEVDEDILRLYLANKVKSEGWLKSTLSNRIRFIRAFFNWVHQEGYITVNPARKIYEPKQGLRIPKAMSEENIELLREACVTLRDKAFFELLYSSGCRIGEIVLLNRNSVDYENLSAIVRGKGDKEREVYFNIRCKIALRRYMNSRTDTNIFLFVNERNPQKPAEIAALRLSLKRIAKRAQIKESVYPHKLRHTYAMHLLNNGASMEFIQSMLGHSKIETTYLYAQLSGARRRELYKKYF
jgi:integrase/recombinase XerD